MYLLVHLSFKERIIEKRGYAIIQSERNAKDLIEITL